VVPLFVYPQFDPVAFSIPLPGLGSVDVRWYGLMYLLGFFVGWLGLRARAKLPWSPIKPNQVDDAVFYGAIGIIAGGRIGYMLLYGYEELIANPLSLFTVWRGGMSFHGGLIGVLIAMGLFARRIGQPYFAVTDTIATWVAPGLGFGRIGNFINSELWGKPTSPDAPWAVIVDGQARHPSQLYEALLEGLVLFVALFFFSRKPRPTMAVSGLFLTLYGVFRILIEFIRVPDGGLYLAFGWLTRGQVYSAPMVVAGIVLLVLAYRSKATPHDAGGGTDDARSGMKRAA
jgi:phosphatidylglycerol:prolipoprotein diacylglycerol transferase